jgi:REP element-mobilizing transposase RayT
MARALKIEFPNAFYHVMSRGQNRQTLFFSPEDFNIFINLIRTEVKKFNIKIFAFCLMTNHYHLYLSTPDANLSKFIKSINQRYAQYYLKKYPERDGHVFRGRYKRVLVENELYSKNLLG